MRFHILQDGLNLDILVYYSMGNGEFGPRIISTEGVLAHFLSFSHYYSLRELHLVRDKIPTPGPYLQSDIHHVSIVDSPQLHQKSKMGG
jgi:hypothetical protein